MMSKLDEYLTVRDAAEYLGVSPNTMRSWGNQGKVVMHRNPINGYRLFKVSDLDRFLKSLEATANRKATNSKAAKRKPK